MGKERDETYVWAGNEREKKERESPLRYGGRGA